MAISNTNTTLLPLTSNPPSSELNTTKSGVAVAVRVDNNVELSWVVGMSPATERIDGKLQDARRHEPHAHRTQVDERKGVARLGQLGAVRTSG